MRFDKNKDDAVIHLIKIVNMIFIIYGHRFIYFIGFSKFNTEYIERVRKTELIRKTVYFSLLIANTILLFYRNDLSVVI